jgi:two-component system response regulator GlrR
MSQNILSTKLKKILVIEDDISIGEVIQLILSQDAAYKPLVIDNPHKAVETAKSLQPDLFIIDYHLSGMDGIRLYDEMHRSNELQAIPAIITTASLESHMQELEERGLVGLAKPFDIDDLLDTVKQAML